MGSRQMAKSILFARRRTVAGATGSLLRRIQMDQ
jgi:hypothetical protein